MQLNCAIKTKTGIGFVRKRIVRIKNISQTVRNHLTDTFKTPAVRGNNYYFFFATFLTTTFFAGAFFATGLAATFFATGFFATGFLTATFFAGAFFATGFAAGFFAAGFAATFFATGFATGFAAAFFAADFLNKNAILSLLVMFWIEQMFFVLVLYFILNTKLSKEESDIFLMNIIF